jgi:hypothetical protein
MFQRPNPRFLPLLGLFQGAILATKSLILSTQLRDRRAKLNVLGFEFLNPALQPRGVCFHPLVLEV